MAEKRRFKMNRGEFNNRFADRDRERDEDETPEYIMLLNKHREFERTFGKRERRDDRPRERRESRGERREFKGGERPRRDDRKGFGGKPFDRDNNRRPRRDDREGGNGKSFGKKPFDRKPKRF